MQFKPYNKPWHLGGQGHNKVRYFNIACRIENNIDLFIFLNRLADHIMQ